MAAQSNLDFTIERPKITERDVKDPVLLRAKLDRAYDEILSLHRDKRDMQKRIDALEADARKPVLPTEQQKALDSLVRQGVSGFMMVPAVGAPPTGVPTTLSGGVPFCIEKSTGKLWAYINGAWKSTTLT